MLDIKFLRENPEVVKQNILLVDLIPSFWRDSFCSFQPGTTAVFPAFMRVWRVPVPSYNSICIFSSVLSCCFSAVRFYIRSIEFIVIAWRSASISSALSMI